MQKVWGQPVLSHTNHLCSLSLRLVSQEQNRTFTLSKQIPHISATTSCSLTPARLQIQKNLAKACSYSQEQMTSSLCSTEVRQRHSDSTLSPHRLQTSPKVPSPSGPFPTRAYLPRGLSLGCCSAACSGPQRCTEDLKIITWL